MIAIVDERMPRDAKSRLSELGFFVISLPPFSRIAAPVASHPDMLMLPLGNRLFVYKEYYEAHASLLDTIAETTARKLCTVDTAVSTQYPDDVGLNLFTVGKHLLGRTDKTPRKILDYAEEQGYMLHFVKQGYAKCSTVVLGDCAVITADPSILEVTNAIGVASLSISAGGASLPGYDYGFLGGTCGVFGECIFFCGTLDSHPDGAAIADFCHSHGFEPILLSDRPLFDVGSIFFL